MFTNRTAQSRLMGEGVMLQTVPPHTSRGGARVFRLMTPGGGLMLALGVSAVLWTGLVEGFHLLHLI